MGTADPAERALIQGLIKLAAADVHGVRGNPRGVAGNLVGARDRLRVAAASGVATPRGLRIDRLLVDVESRLARAERGETTGPIDLPWDR